ncbi:hypothetical protein I6N91_07130 [Arthrobacter sp. MSA 4-2]|uniref:hypothetical protein n=1 Tax=Arthrobacter sp. MSA 4-2 TaxID=2794349 RepID=UPI0018E78D00|nr:hypothetical protein [Arthrobacter sp. MSA 4-2]MBJ2120751.1 hypothetical protein [Arthrobacter sp. MSA 4-2]
MSTAAVRTPEPAASPRVAGHNRITTQALVSTARAAAAEHFGVQAAQVRAVYTDDVGLLALELSLPVPIPPLARVAAEPSLSAPSGGSVLERARQAKAGILATVATLTGTRLSRVDIRVIGTASVQGRVR